MLAASFQVGAILQPLMQLPVERGADPYRMAHHEPLADTAAEPLRGWENEVISSPQVTGHEVGGWRRAASPPTDATHPPPAMSGAADVQQIRV
jgi:hypothetical protein